MTKYNPEYPERNPLFGYVPFEYPEHKEYIPELAKEYAGFQWNLVPTTPAPNMANCEYDIGTARAALASGVRFEYILSKGE